MRFLGFCSVLYAGICGAHVSAVFVCLLCLICLDVGPCCIVFTRLACCCVCSTHAGVHGACPWPSSIVLPLSHLSPHLSQLSNVLHCAVYFACRRTWSWCMPRSPVDLLHCAHLTCLLCCSVLMHTGASSHWTDMLLFITCRRTWSVYAPQSWSFGCTAIVSPACCAVVCAAVCYVFRRTWSMRMLPTSNACRAI
jgi:hypothetical protein